MSSPFDRALTGQVDGGLGQDAAVSPQAGDEERVVESALRPHSLHDFIGQKKVARQLALVLEGDSAIEVVRGINGATDGRKAAPGTIRGDYSLSNRENLVHGSDSPESAEREIGIWFPELSG